MDLLALSLPYWYVWITALQIAWAACLAYLGRLRANMEAEIVTGRIYKILLTDNVKDTTEKIGMNIYGMCAVVMGSEIQGRVKVRVNTEARIWTDIIELNTSDLQAI